jgi:hypothetical protein
MKNKSLRIKILSGMLSTGLVLSASTFSFAAERQVYSTRENFATSMDIKVPVEKCKEVEQRHAKMKVAFEVVIKESIEEKVITKDEGDKVLKYMAEKFEKKYEDKKDCKKARDHKEKAGLFNELVSEGILTKEKADALREKMYIKKSDMRNEEIQKGLNTLVENKVLTSDQSKKVAQAIKVAQEEKKENFKRMKELSETEKQEFMKKMRYSKVNPLKALVEDGTITKEQEIEIQKILPHHHHHHQEHK